MIWKRLNNHRIANGPFAATSITSLTSETQPAKRKRSPKKPTYPTLQEFASTQPDYKEYCNPKILEHPHLFTGKVTVSRTNPCYHTFNAEMVQGGEEKGISERSFWSCSMRSKVRAHKKGTADVEQQEDNLELGCQSKSSTLTYARDPKTAGHISDPSNPGTRSSQGLLEMKFKSEEAQNIAKKQRALQITQLALELTSAIVGAIPIGNHGTSGKTGQENIANEKKNDMISVEGQAGHDKAVRHDAALASLEEEEDYSLYWLPVEEEEDEFLSAKDHRSVREDQDGDAQNAAAKPSQYYLKFSQDSLKDTAAAAAKVFEIAQAPWSSSSSESLLSRFKEIKAKTLPTYEETDDRVSYNTKLIDADWSDCLPLQYGLSKVMCDLFCLQDSVRAGTSAVLESLEDSHNILMQNLEALLDYQTSYILWALYNAAASATKDADLQTEAPPEASALLAALRQIDFKHVQATTPRLSRDILQWHQAAGQNLYNRLASLTVNASKQSWPLRVK
ncbi:unnamed protein product, partial [Symbiodinium sp. KB8]